MTVLLCIALGLVVLALAYFLGKKEVEKTKAEEINEVVAKAMRARDKLHNDPTRSHSVRSRFTRDVL